MMVLVMVMVTVMVMATPFAAEPLMPSDGMLTRVNSLPVPIIQIPLQKVENDRLTSMLLATSTSTPVSLQNFDNTQYIGTIYVGTPAKKFDVIFDTGSANTWIYSSACMNHKGPGAGQCSKRACTQHSKFVHETSTSYKANGTNIEIKYGSGAVNGRLFLDTMAFGTQPESKKVENFHLLGAACVYAPPYDVFDDSPFDGVVGLGFDSLGIPGTKSIMRTLVDRGVIPEDQQLFSFYLTTGAKAGSIFTLGGVNPEHVDGSVAYHPVLGDHKHWSLQLTGLKVGDWSMDVGANCNGACPVVPDTGTSLMTGPEYLVKQILKKMGEVKEDCSNADNLKPIIFQIRTIDGGTIDYTLQASDHVLRVEEDGVVKCYDGMYGMDMPAHYGKMFILGDIFLAKYLTVFDVKNRRVGIAKSKHPSLVV